MFVAVDGIGCFVCAETAPICSHLSAVFVLSDGDDVCFEVSLFDAGGGGGGGEVIKLLLFLLFANCLVI